MQQLNACNSPFQIPIIGMRVSSRRRRTLSLLRWYEEGIREVFGGREIVTSYRQTDVGQDAEFESRIVRHPYFRMSLKARFSVMCNRSREVR